MSETFQCPTCHHEERIYTHTVNRSLAHMVLKLKRAVLDHDRNNIHPVKDTAGKPYKVTPDERSNWTYLRYHGLAAQTDTPGHWLLTKRGNDFVKGGEIPAKTRVLNGHPIHDREPDGQYYITISELLSDESRPLYTQIENLERELVPLEITQEGFGFDVPVIAPVITNRGAH